MTDPLVSIVIPVYNRVNLVCDAVDSAINQTHKNCEVVIVDNASTDGTWEALVDHYSANDKVRLYRNSENIGPVKNWVAGIKHAEGEYIKILFSDDTLSSDCVEKLLSVISDDSLFAFSNAIIGASRSSGRLLFKDSRESGVEHYSNFWDEFLLMKGSLVSPGAAIFRGSFLKSADFLNGQGLESEGFSYYGAGPDLLMFLLALMRTERVGYVDEPLSFFRDHNGSTTSAVTNSRAWPIRDYYNYTRTEFARRNLSRDVFCACLLRWLITSIVENKMKLSDTLRIYLSGLSIQLRLLFILLLPKSIYRLILANR